MPRRHASLAQAPKHGPWARHVPCRPARFGPVGQFWKGLTGPTAAPNSDVICSVWTGFASRTHKYSDCMWQALDYMGIHVHGYPVAPWRDSNFSPRRHTSTHQNKRRHGSTEAIGWWLLAAISRWPGPASRRRRRVLGS